MEEIAVLQNYYGQLLLKSREVDLSVKKMRPDVRFRLRIILLPRINHKKGVDVALRLIWAVTLTGLASARGFGY